jgi:hypothetical protein
MVRIVGNQVVGLVCYFCNIVIDKRMGDAPAQGGGVDMKNTSVTADVDGYWDIDLTSFGDAPSQIALLIVYLATGDPSEFAPHA